MLLKRWMNSRRVRIARRRARPLKERLLKEWVIPITVIAGVMAPLRASVADWNDVPTGSMRPTILEGDRIYVNKLAYGLRVPFTELWLTRWGEPERGDIVVFSSPRDGTRLVKRVVGLPGDRVRLQDNVLYVNGVAMAESAPVDEPAVRTSSSPIPVVLATEMLGKVEHAIALTPSLKSVSGNFREVVVPAGELFMLGDNRDQSSDSRVIGFVPLSSVYGKSSYVALSLDYASSGMPRWDRFFMAMR